ncbi:MAG: TonB-dependent receptor [Deltaproteobacteria bacterium]|nr:TonB-dependent receptor [Candidatus Zymogenaceae bacterium]
MRRVGTVLLLVLFLIGGAAFALESDLHRRETKPERGQGQEQKKKETSPPAEQEEKVKSYRVKGSAVVVTSTRTEERIVNVPYSAVSLDFDYLINLKQARTIPEALSEVPGVMVQKTGHARGCPYIRGFPGFRNLFLIDGIRLNNSVFRDGPNQYWGTIDSLIAERVELVAGPSSVLYGSDAIGGTVQVITRERSRYEQDFGLNGRAYYRFGGAESSHTGRLELQGNKGRRLGFLLGVGLKQYGDLRAGARTGVMPKTGYDQQSLDLKFNYAVDEDRELVLGLQHDNIDDAWRTHRTVFSKSWLGTTIGTDKELLLDQRRQLAYLQYRWDRVSRHIDQAVFSLSWHRQYEGHFRRRNDGARTIDGFDVGTAGFWGQFVSRTRLGKLTYGWEYYLDFVDSFREDPDDANPAARISPRGPVADDARYHLFGLYLQNETPLLDSLDLTAGLRYSWAKAAAAEVGMGNIEPAFAELPKLDQRYSSVVGNLRLLYHLDDHWNIYGGAAQGFRAPNLSDLTRFDIARSGEHETPSLSVKPEKYLSLEAGVKCLHRTWQGSLSYFRLFIDGMIIRVPTGNMIGANTEVTRRNIGDGRMHGLEAAGILHLSGIGLPHWTGAAALSWIEGDTDTFPTSAAVVERRPMSRIQPATAALSLRWEHPSARYWAEGVMTAAGAQRRLSPDDERDTQRIPPGGTPGYAVFTVRGGIVLSRTARLLISLENIADQDYRILGSGLNEPGRNLVIGLDLGF